ncbi:MAG: hypothetical protein ACHQLQ_13235, partial [Candidatus Acidiferrales bacterium]
LPLHPIPRNQTMAVYTEELTHLILALFARVGLFFASLFTLPLTSEFIRTIGVLLRPLRLPVNPFFSSPSSRQPLCSVYRTIRTHDPFFPADFRRNPFLISNFHTRTSAFPRSNDYYII